MGSGNGWHHVSYGAAGRNGGNAIEMGDWQCHPFHASAPPLAVAFHNLRTRSKYLPTPTQCRSPSPRAGRPPAPRQRKSLSASASLPFLLVLNHSPRQLIPQHAPCLYSQQAPTSSFISLSSHTTRSTHAASDPRFGAGDLAPSPLGTSGPRPAHLVQSILHSIVTGVRDKPHALHHGHHHRLLSTGLRCDKYFQ